MIYLNEHKHWFKEHIAYYKEFDEFKILEFKNPNTNHYYIKFVFDEKRGTIVIDGDLGQLYAGDVCTPITFENFNNFLDNIHKFNTTIIGSDRGLFSYDLKLAEKEVMNDIYERNCNEKIEYDFFSIENFLDEVFEDFDYNNGTISTQGNALLRTYIYLDPPIEFGKYDTGMLSIYKYAFNEALNDLELQKKELSL